MGLPWKLRFWRYYSNPISCNHFSIIKWGLTQTWGKMRDAFTIVQTHEIADRREVYRKYDEIYHSGRVDFPTVALIEEMVAADVAEALRAEGVRVFPPVIFKAYLTPSILVLSKRNRIQKVPPDPLFRTGLSTEQREEIENFVEKLDPSLRAYVVDLGGIAIFPPIVHLYPAPLLVEVAAHEWCHTHLVFFPLGFSYLRSAEVAAVNEIACSIVGRDVLQRVRTKYGRTVEAAAPPEEQESGRPDYGEMIRAIRQEVDRLLGSEMIEEAETFMRESTASLRQHWPDHAELDQAYFAFHGKYGGGAGGADPTERQLEELRRKAGSLKNFLKLIRGVYSRRKFKEVLEREGIE